MKKNLKERKRAIKLIRKNIEKDDDLKKVNLEIDISTGDKITPKELKFKYPLLFEDRSISINSYNIEIILAEKRNSIEYLDDYKQIIESILQNEKMECLWIKYSNKNIYAQNIIFSKILKLLKEFIEKLNVIITLA
ncbi:MAG: hypothetical protein RRY16_02510 [Bacilli bacterium]